MSFNKKKLVTIICEAQLENDLLKDFVKLEVPGHSICEAKGEGSRGTRAGDWEQSRNIRIEIVCSDQEAHKVMEHLRKEYYDDYAMISYMTEVEVMRDKKFN